jgi:riboflavin kinase / FMN adenylyltransferase
MMEVVRLDAASAPRWPRPSVAVGNFDGVHRGHQALVASAVSVATASGGTAVVLTFDPHPARVIAPEAAPTALMTLGQKAATLARLGVKAMAVLPFTPEVAAASPEEFAARVLHRALGADTVVVGTNFRFGRGRAGDVDMLRHQGAALGFRVVEVPPVVVLGERVSSSRVREALARGDAREAAALLGRPHCIEGRVVPGDGRGRTIGVPTANLEPGSETLPALGVYAAWCWPGHAAPGAAAVVNIGRRPTFGGGAVSVEAHLLDFAGDLYGRPMSLSFVSRLRGERTFPGADALVAQIHQDMQAARDLLSGPPPASPWDGL